MRASIRASGWARLMSVELAPAKPPSGWRPYFDALKQDRLAFGSAIYLVVLVIAVLVGGWVMSDLATDPALRMRNIAPFTLDQGFAYILGSDSLGRSILARIIVGGARTLGVAAITVLIASVVGTLIGIYAGYRGRIFDTLVMRFADVSLAFPGILLAVVLLYIFPPDTWTVVAVLVINRLPLYIRVARAETLEVRERLFVSAAKVLGAGAFTIMRRHIFPVILPTILTVAALDLAVVMLVESSLSFLGMGVQPPAISWGLMVADGRRYLRAAWWLTVFPGLAIVFTAIAINVFSNWLRVVLDPVQSAKIFRQSSAPDDVEERA